MSKPRRVIRVAIMGTVPEQKMATAAQFVHRCLQQYPKEEIEIISARVGGFADRFGRDNQLPVKHIEADWHRNGRLAGVLCDREILRDATHLIAFWDGRTDGMKHLIQLGQKRCKAVRVWNTRIGKHDRTYYH